MMDLSIVLLKQEARSERCTKHCRVSHQLGGGAGHTDGIAQRAVRGPGQSTASTNTLTGLLDRKNSPSHHRPLS